MRALESQLRANFDFESEQRSNSMTTVEIFEQLNLDPGKGRAFRENVTRLGCELSNQGVKRVFLRKGCVSEPVYKMPPKKFIDRERRLIFSGFKLRLSPISILKGILP